MWATQAGKFTTSKKVKIDFFLLKFSVTKIVMWKCHVDESTNCRYKIILGRDLLTTLGLDLKFSENVIIGGEGPYEGCSAPMVDVKKYNFKSITDKTVKPEESFLNLYVNECFESDNTISSTRIMRRILYAKYEKADLNEVMNKQCQKHLTTIERHSLLQLLKKLEDLFDGTLGTWNTTLLELELNEDAKPMCS